MTFPARQMVIDQLRSMASEEYQKVEWTKNVKTTWFFPTEILCIWFDDLGFRDKDRLGFEKEFTSDEWASLLAVSLELDNFQKEFEKDGNNLGADIGDYLPWKRVVEVSKKALSILGH